MLLPFYHSSLSALFVQLDGSILVTLEYQ
jgi:hypothetical protein